MEQSNNPNLVKNAMTSGALLGVALIILNLIFYFTKAINSSILMIFIPILLYIAIFFLGIFYFTKSYRDKLLDGFISYKTALFMGVLIALFSGIIYSFYYYLFNEFIDVKYYGSTLISIQETITQFFLKHNIPEDQIEEQLKVFKKPIPKVFDMAMSKIMIMTFWGLILSLIIAAFLKKEKSTFSDNLK